MSVLLSALVAAAPKAAHGAAEAAPQGGALLGGGLPFPLLISLIALAFLGTLVCSRIAIHLRLPAVVGVLVLGLLLHPGQSVLSLTQVENLHVVSLSMLLFCAGLNAELHHLRGFLRYGVLLAVGGVLLTTLVFAPLLWGIHAAIEALWPALGVVALPVPVALMAAANPQATAAQIRSTSISTVTPVSGLAGKWRWSTNPTSPRSTPMPKATVATSTGLGWV